MIRVELKEDEITAALASLSRALVNKMPVMEEIGDYMRQSTKDRMARGETPEGTPFTPRSQTTLDIYARKKFSYGLPLHLTGTMIEQINFATTENEVTIGSNAIQAAVMQFGAAKGSLGGGSPWGNIPARPFLGISADDRTNIIDIIDEWLDLATKGGA